MNGVFLVSILAALFLTYKLITVLKNKEGHKGNKKIALSLYVLFIIALAAVNITYS
ncbi:hypothetical protein LF817_13200 [Halobacillus sp. A1]|uniref:hypothetical protein n=1 Tax=Halobacillus sp. A1 TaxID=2880262 RepID=UPI0020A62AA4|nr:hypothetical protein [Halobacillus sp. A1]MCP3032298.1 hypothetical protein [Halobacillus sp. A1]